jgi:hypothetical protein
MIAIQENSIPFALKSQPHWILWKLEGKTETFKGTKIPYNPKNPFSKASTTDPTTWESFGYTISMADMHNVSGIGYVFTEDQGIVAIDIDNAISENGIDEKAKKVLDLFAGKTYIEKSHSGTGFHILCKGNMPDVKLKGIEVYNSGRYFAITGKLFEGITDINPLQTELTELYSLYADVRKSVPLPKPQQQHTESWVNCLNLRVEDIGYPDNATVQSDGEVRGSHPFHGSTTGNNYAINTHKNTWICRRDGHNSGGGPLELFAVKEGIIRCEDARSGCLNGKWKEVANALKRCGYKLPDNPKKTPPKKIGIDIKNPADIHCTDFGNAERFLNKYSRDVLYCKVQDGWYIWNQELGIWDKDNLLKYVSMLREYYLIFIRKQNINQNQKIDSV